jgi:hypothetical protein
MKIFDMHKSTFILDGTMPIEKAIALAEGGIALVVNDGKYVTIKIEDKEE